MVDPSQLLSISNISLSYKDYPFLENLDKLATRSLSKNKVEKALSYMSQSLNLRKALYGESSHRYKVKFPEIFSAVFPVAIQQLERGEYEKSIKSLNSLQELLRSSSLTIEKAEIFNSLACNYRKLKDWSQAKSCIKRALTESLPKRTLSSIYLNLAHIYTDMKQFPKAITACKRSVRCTQGALVEGESSSSKNAELLITNLALSYYLLGKIHQDNNDNRNAAKWYTKAIVFLKNNAGPTQQGLLQECFKKHREVLSESSTDEARPIIKNVASQASNLRTKTPISRGISPVISLKKLPPHSLRKMSRTRKITPVRLAKRKPITNNFMLHLKPMVSLQEGPDTEQFARRIQAFYRGARIREKFQLLKNQKSRIIERTAKKFEELVMLSLSDKLEVTVYSNGQEYTEKFTEAVKLAEIFFNKEFGIFRLINRREITIKNNTYELRAYQKDQRLLLQLESTKTLRLILTIPESTSALNYLEEITPKLDVEEDSLRIFTPEDIKHIQNIQNVFRRRRIQPPAKETILCKSEKKIGEDTYLFIISSTANLVKIDAFPLYGSPEVQSLTKPMNEVKKIINEQDLVKNKQKIFEYIEIIGSQIILSEFISHPNPIFSDEFVLNNTFPYTLNFYDTSVENKEGIMIEALETVDAPTITSTLLLSKTEISNILQIEEESIPENLKSLGDLVIIEEGNTLSLSNRKYSEININVILDTFDDFMEPFLKKKPKSTYKKTTEDYVKTIQRSWRRYQKYQLSLLKQMNTQRKEMIGRHGVKLDDTYFIVSVYADDKKTYVTAYSPEKSMNYTAETNIMYDFAYVIQNLEFNGDEIFIYSTESEDSSSSEGMSDAPVLSSEKSISGQTATVNIYKEISSFYIEIVAEGLFCSNRFTFDELYEIYNSSEVTPELLYQNIDIHEDEICVDPPKSPDDRQTEYLPPPIEEKIVLRTTKISADKMYTVVMHLKRKSMTGNELKDDDLLQFEVYANSSNKKTISMTLSRASQQTGIPKDNLVPLGNYLISRMLVVSDYYIGFDSNAPSVNLSNVATRLQAAYKGYLARKQMTQIQSRSSSMLIISKNRMMAGKMYVVDAYDRGSRIKLEARCENEVLHCFVKEDDIFAFEEGLDRDQVIENVIIPSLYILELNDRKQLCIEPNFQITAQLLDNRKYAKDRQDLDRAYRPVYRPRLNISPISSYSILPTVFSKRNVILKTFATLSGRTVEISFIDDGQLTIETEHLKLNTSKFIGRLSQRQKENLCLDLLPKLRMRGNRLLIDEDMSEVIYKNMHWVRDKFMSVCVLTSDHATSLEATDLDSQQIYSFKISSTRRNKSSFNKENIEEIISKCLAKSLN